MHLHFTGLLFRCMYWTSNAFATRTHSSKHKNTRDADSYSGGFAKAFWRNGSEQLPSSSTSQVLNTPRCLLSLAAFRYVSTASSERQSVAVFWSVSTASSPIRAAVLWRCSRVSRSLTSSKAVFWSVSTASSPIRAAVLWRCSRVSRSLTSSNVSFGRR
jgi:hypothetical protein